MRDRLPDVLAIYAGPDRAMKDSGYQAHEHFPENEALLVEAATDIERWYEDHGAVEFVPTVLLAYYFGTVPRRSVHRAEAWYNQRFALAFEQRSARLGISRSSFVEFDPIVSEADGGCLLVLAIKNGRRDFVRGCISMLDECWRATGHELASLTKGGDTGGAATRTRPELPPDLGTAPDGEDRDAIRAHSPECVRDRRCSGRLAVFGVLAIATLVILAFSPWGSESQHDGAMGVGTAASDAQEPATVATVPRPTEIRVTLHPALPGETDTKANCELKCWMDGEESRYRITLSRPGDIQVFAQERGGLRPLVPGGLGSEVRILGTFQSGTVRLSSTRSHVPLCLLKVEEGWAYVCGEGEAAIGGKVVALGVGRSTASCLGLLNSSDAILRAGAARDLGRLAWRSEEASDAVDRIEECLRDREPIVRRAAVEALGLLATPRALRALETLLLPGDDSSDRELARGARAIAAGSMLIDGVAAGRTREDLANAYLDGLVPKCMSNRDSIRESLMDRGVIEIGGREYRIGDRLLADSQISWVDRAMARRLSGSPKRRARVGEFLSSERSAIRLFAVELLAACAGVLDEDMRIPSRQLAEMSLLDSDRTVRRACLYVLELLKRKENVVRTGDQSDDTAEPPAVADQEPTNSMRDQRSPGEKQPGSPDRLKFEEARKKTVSDLARVSLSGDDEGRIAGAEQRVKELHRAIVSARGEGSDRARAATELLGVFRAHMGSAISNLSSTDKQSLKRDLSEMDRSHQKMLKLLE